MRILHTSDWHLGRALNRHQRYPEFEKFLLWLSQTIISNQIEALLVAGDIFDTTTPGNRAQELYYRFLCRIAGSCCRNIIITAGNHDSPTFLEAPKELLKALNIHVIGNPCQDVADEVILLKNSQNEPEAIVCSVPYLRDRDIRISVAGESIEDKSANLISGIKDHYARVAQIALDYQSDHPDLPIIGMGHLFTAGGQTVKDDGTRDLYVGTLAHISAGELPQCFDYLALGHLHQAQIVNHNEAWRYSGSPIQMSFAEAGQTKKVIMLEFNGKKPTIIELPVPCFQPLAKVCGNFAEITACIEKLKAEQSNAWLEVEYNGSEIEAALSARLQEQIKDSNLEIKVTRDRTVLDKVMQQSHTNETLDDISVNEVFLRCLDANGVPEEQRQELIHSYNEIVSQIHEEDVNAE